MDFQQIQQHYIHRIDKTKIAIFASERTARQHLEKHLFGLKEMDQWNIVFSYLKWPEADYYQKEISVNKGFSLHKSLQSGDETAFQELYQLAALTVKNAVDNAVDKGLYKTNKKGDITVTYSIFGVLTVIKQDETGSVLLTFFIPGFDADYEQTNSDRGKPKNYAQKKGREYQKQQKREEKYSPDEKLYYKVIRPGIQTIRHHYEQNQPTIDEKAANDYALLKPITKQIGKFKQWQNFLP